jgi:anti-sigma factor RsiW
MNCTTYRNDILLAESGELTPPRREALSAHLASCPGCRTFADTSRVLTQSARETLSQETPHPSVMVAIRAAAETRGRGRLLWFPTRMVRLAACAAAIALVAGSAWFAAVPRQQASRVAALSTMVTMVAESTMDDAATMTAVDDDRDLKAVARQLLEMEGFRVDDLIDDEVLSLFEEPAPTTTQWRRTPESPAQRCV